MRCGFWMRKGIQEHTYDVSDGLLDGVRFAQNVRTGL